MQTMRASPRLISPDQFMQPITRLGDSACAFLCLDCDEEELIRSWF